MLRNNSEQGLFPSLKRNLASPYLSTPYPPSKRHEPSDSLERNLAISNESSCAGRSVRNLSFSSDVESSVVSHPLNTLTPCYRRG